ncbi:EKC/KEOPS complex subunit BUD32 [Abortiporus biennis]
MNVVYVHGHLGLNSLVILLLGPIDSEKTEFSTQILQILQGAASNITTNGQEELHVPSIRPLTIIDVPEFLDLTPSAISDVLHTLARSLSASHISVTGMLYIHRISDYDSASNSAHIFNQIHDLLSIEFYRMWIVTTGWDDCNKEMAFSREHQLTVKPHLFKPVLQFGVHMIRYWGTQGSAYEIMSDVLRELDHGLPLNSVNSTFLPPLDQHTGGDLATFLDADNFSVLDQVVDIHLESGTDSNDGSGIITVVEDDSSPRKEITLALKTDDAGVTLPDRLDYAELATWFDNLEYTPPKVPQSHLTRCLICSVSIATENSVYCSDMCKAIDTITRSLYQELIGDMHSDALRWRRLSAALTSKGYQQEFVSLALREAFSANTLEFLQLVFDRLRKRSWDDIPPDVLKDIQSLLRRLLMRFSLASERLPSTLFVGGITRTKDEPVYGGFSDVFRGQDDQGTIFALKRLRSMAIMTETTRANLKKQLYHELLMWRNLNHKYLVPLVGVNETIFSQPPVPCIITPWMPKGHIRGYLYRLVESGGKEGTPQLLRRVHKFMNQILLGLEYLHSEDIVHGDLRSQNILVNEEDNIQISDLGLSVYADATSKMYGSVRGGSEAWIAPEQLDPVKFGLTSERPTKAVDVYSFASVCVELYTGKDPYPLGAMSKFALRAKVVSGGHPERPRFYDGEIMTDSLWDLLVHCWSLNPKDRPKASDLATVLQGVADGQVAYISRSTMVKQSTFRDFFQHSRFGIRVQDRNF